QSLRVVAVRNDVLPALLLLVVLVVEPVRPFRVELGADGLELLFDPVGPGARLALRQRGNLLDLGIELPRAGIVGGEVVARELLLLLDRRLADEHGGRQEQRRETFHRGLRSYARVK